MTTRDLRVAPPNRPDGRIVAVVLDWNQPALTLDCVRALLQSAGPPAVVVVDNGSRPAAAAALAAGLPGGCGLVRNPRNLGFAGGMNVGIRHALRGGAEYVWLMNNDAFPDPGCLSTLVAALAADPRLAAVTPALFYPDGREQPAVGRVGWHPPRAEMSLASDRPEPVGAGYWLCGAALLFRADVLRQTGGFDERFFAYWEEVDLLQRAARLGYQFRAVPGARCVHLESASSGGGAGPFASHMLARNAWRYMRKHVRLPLLPATGLRLLAEQVGQAGVLHARGRAEAARALLGGAVAGLAGRAGRPGRVRAVGRWADAVLAHPWGIGGVIGRAARLFPTGGGS